jgi:dihydrofolate reductase
MRKIVAGIMTSLDGVTDSPEQWMGPYFAPEIGQVVGSIMGAQDSILLGRVTYETLAAHWPQQSGEMAGTIAQCQDLKAASSHHAVP